MATTPGLPLNMIKIVLGRTLLLPALAMLLLGCEHSLKIQGQGDILSGSGARNCTLEQQPCSNSIVADYIETYTAQPRAGWRFDGWEGCDSGDQRCEFNVPASTVQQFWGQSMVLVAKFEPLSAVRVDSGVDQSVTGGTEVVLQGAMLKAAMILPVHF